MNGKGQFALLAALLMITTGLAGCAAPQQPGAAQSACMDDASAGGTMGATIEDTQDAETEASDTLTSSVDALQQPTGDPIKIGTLLPLTGSLQAFGGDMQNAVEMAAADINNSGGVMGRPIEIIEGDSRTSSAEAPQEFSRLVGEDVTAVVGAASSGVTNSVLAQAVDNEVVLITPASTSPALTESDNEGFFFRVPPNDLLQGKVMASLLEEDGIQSASTIYVNNAYGQGLSDQFVSEFDGEVPNQVSFDESATQFNSEVTQASQGDPEAIVAVMYPGNGAPLVREAFSQGLTSEAKFYFSEGLFSGDFVDDVGTNDEGDSIIADCKGTTPEVLLNPGPESFQNRFNETYGHDPGLFAAQSYDATIAVALGMAYSQSTDAATYQEGMETIWNTPGTNVSDVTQALALVQTGQDINWQGPSGDFDWNEDHDPVRGTYGIWQVTPNGTIEILERGIEVELDS